MTDPDELLSPARAAALLGISRYALWRRGNAGQIGYVEDPVTKRRKYRRRSLDGQLPRTVEPTDREDR